MLKSISIQNLVANTVIIAWTVLAACSFGLDGGGNRVVIEPSVAYSKKQELVELIIALVFCCITTVIMNL